jgi:hypothetical protein
MDRMNISKNGTAGVFCAMAMLLIAAQSFGAVTNSFFNSSLEGWTVNKDTRVVWSPTGFYDELGNGSALLQQTPAAVGGTLPDSSDSSILSQSFDVDPRSFSLTFQVKTPAPAIGDETNHFYIKLLYSLDKPLIENSGKDYFFHWKSSSAGWIQEETPGYETPGSGTPSGITINEDDSNIDSRLYSFNITVPPSWITKNITLQFKLDNDYINSSASSILIDNVELNVQSSDPVVVPIPSAIGLILTGLTALGIFKKKLA